MTLPPWQNVVEPLVTLIVAGVKSLTVTVTASEVAEQFVAFVATTL